MKKLWKSILLFTIGLSAIVLTFLNLLNSDKKSSKGSYSGSQHANHLFIRSEDYTPTICYDENNNPSHQCLGGWFYKVGDKKAEENAAFAKKHNWNFVFLSSNVKSKSARQRLVKNVKAFRAQDIAVHIMCLEDTAYLDNPTAAYDEISSILKYVNEQKLDIQGIHIDCEPHATTEWKLESNRNTIFKHYLEVIEKGREAINDERPNTTYSAAVAWWYSHKAKNNELDYGRGDDLVNSDRLDFIVPMIYDEAGGTVERVIERSEDYISDKAGTVIGIAVKDYDYNSFQNITQEITNIRRANEYFNGISVYANKYYPDWKS